MMMIMMIKEACLADLGCDDDDDDDNKPVWPIWAEGALSGCRMSKHTATDARLK
jgi:hypothetical protein